MAFPIEVVVTMVTGVGAILVKMWRDDRATKKALKQVNDNQIEIKTNTSLLNHWMKVIDEMKCDIVEIKYKVGIE